jgi:spore maturation protein CgeB
MREVWIGVNYNLYESKRYFSAKLAEAFRRKGVAAQIVDVDTQLFQYFAPGGKLRKPKPDFFCSFNRTVPNEKGQFYWDVYNLPHLSILVDPAFYDTNIIHSPLSLISCVDRFDCEFLKGMHYNQAFFLPHAVEPELGSHLSFDDNDRPYDVVFLGSSYDPDGLQAAWTSKYPEQNWPLIQSAIETCLKDKRMTFWEAAQWVREQDASNPHLLSHVRLSFYIDNMVRGIDRVEVIRAIKKAQVHVFGGTSWRKETPIKGWGQYFIHQPNVVVHPAIPFNESLEVLKKSKICLNSMPFFKDGTHERIFTGLACGSLPITTDNLWVEENFVNSVELLLYQPFHWAHIDDLINEYLANGQKRRQIVQQGHAKVMQDHTWDNRVELLLEKIPPLLEHLID